MREYSPKRRTAVVFTGTGVSGAYHAGALRALEESGVKLDLFVGSGVGTLAAAFGAVAGSAKLYGPGGFWERLAQSRLYRLRPEVVVLQALLGVGFGFFLLPFVVALLAALVFPFLLLADWMSPGVLARFTALLPSLAALRSAYIVALALPVFALFVAGGLHFAIAALRDRRRMMERFEHVLDAKGARSLIRGKLWEIVRGADATSQPPREEALGEKYVALASENRGQLGFRELVLRAADLELGRVQCAVLLSEETRAAFATARGARRAAEAGSGVIDLQAPGAAALLFPTVFTGLLPPLVTPPERLTFPKGLSHAGEIHRLTESTLLGGCGIAEALDAGAEQVLVVSASAERPTAPLRRRGPRALADAILESLERDAFEREVLDVARLNRMVETLGHRSESGGRAWQDPATGRVHRDVSLYVVRPDSRSLRPLDHAGTYDPATEVEEIPEDLLQRGYKDTLTMFVEPVVGASPMPQRLPDMEDEGQPVEL